MKPADGLPTIASFWYGSDLTWLEQVCIQSYLDRGHRFVLYLAHEVGGLPAGVEQRAASEVFWPAPFDVSDNDRHRVAVFSDLFRLHLMRKTPHIWVDLDAYCVRAFDFDGPYVFGCTPDGRFPNGVLRLPQGSKTLERLLAFVTEPNPTQPWRGRALKRANRRRVAAGETWGIETLPWGCSGPKALTHFLQETGEGRYAQPSEVFYPLTPEQLGQLHMAPVSSEAIERKGVYSVHIYGHQKRIIANKLGGQPNPGSYLDRICQRHGIDPALSPIRPEGWLAPK